jgi:phosphoserine phosphatase RsbU/P
MNKCLAKVFRESLLISLSVLIMISASQAHAARGGGGGREILPPLPEVAFTQEERAWLDQHPIVRVATSPGWAPVSFLGNDGNFQGIAIDFLRQLEPLLGVKFEFIQADHIDPNKTPEIISAISNPAVNTPDGFTAIAKPFLKSPLGIYVSKESRNISSLEDLSGKKVAVFQSKLAFKLLSKDHPQIKLVKADIADEALADVVSGKVDAYVGNTAVVSFVISRQGFSAVKLAGLTPYFSELHMATKSDEPLLTSALQKATNALLEVDKGQIFKKWVSVSYDAQTDYRLLGLAFALLIIFGCWIFILRRQIKLRYKAEVSAKAMTEASLDCLITIDVESKIVEFNPAAESTFGYQKKEVLGKSMADLIIPAVHRRNHEEGMKRYLATGEGPALRNRFEITAMHKDGSEFPVELTIVPFEIEKHKYFLGSLRDISEKKRIERDQETLKSMNEELLSEMKLMQDAMDEHTIVSVTNLNGEITYVNKKFTAISGYSADELIGGSHRVIKSGLHSESFYKDMWKTISSGKIWHGVLANKNKNGAIYWVSSTIVPMLDEASNPVKYIAIRTDITEQHRLAEELHSSIARENRIGMEIQQTLLYGEAPKIQGTDIHLFTEASHGVDGDFYGSFVFSEGLFDFVIGDVMGKGVAAALVAAAVKQKISQILAEQQSRTLTNLPAPEEIINELHHFITPRLIQIERFVTLAYCRFDISNKIFSIVDAGHNCTIHASEKGTSSCQLGDGLPIGVRLDEIYNKKEFRISEGDFIVLYSDGVTEARNNNEDFFGTERLLSIVEQLHRHDTPACIASDYIEHHLKLFESSTYQRDDRTLVVIKIPQQNPDCHPLTLKWDSSEIANVRQWIITSCFTAGLEEDFIQSLVLASVETFTNILRHGNNLSAQASIHICVDLSPETIEVVFNYVGEHFVPSEPKPDFSGNSDGGFGLFIIRQSVDIVDHVEVLPGICRIRLVKRKHATIRNPE